MTERLLKLGDNFPPLDIQVVGERMVSVVAGRSAHQIYLRGYYPHLGRKHQGLSGVETLVYLVKKHGENRAVKK